MSPAIEIDGLSLTLTLPGERRPILEGVSLRCGPGEMVGLVGESGSGKSLTLRSSLRLLPRGAETTGRVLVSGIDVLACDNDSLRQVRRQKAAMIFQDPRAHINPVRRLEDFLTEGLRLAGADRESARARVCQLLEAVGLDQPTRVLRQFPHELSGGMLQRVMIAAALTGEPDVLLADEPTTALDVTTQAEIMAILQQLRRERNLAVVLVTHDIPLAAAVCDRVFVMYAGKIMEEAAASDLFERPAHPYTAGLFRSSPRREARGQKLDAIPGQPQGLHEVPTGCVFAARCEFAQPVCLGGRPNLTQRAGRRTACVRWPEISQVIRPFLSESENEGMTYVPERALGGTG